MIKISVNEFNIMMMGLPNKNEMNWDLIIFYLLLFPSFPHQDSFLL